MIDVNLRGVLHGIDAALPVFERQGRGHFVTIVSTAGLKIVPTMAVYAATKNAVRTMLEGLRQESTDGTLKTTAISPGLTCAPSSATASPTRHIRAEIGRGMAEFALDPDAVAQSRSSSSSTNPGRSRSANLSIRPTSQGVAQPTVMASRRSLMKSD